MLTRILTSAVGIIIFFGALFAPPQVFAAAIFVVTAVMLSEVYRVLACNRAVNVIGFVSAALVAAGSLAGKVEAAVTALVVLYLFTVVFFHTKTDSRNIAAHGFLTIFVTLFMTSIAKLNMDVGALGVLWIFIIAWMTDTGAYFSGVLLGKHKLVPHISPKKTVEGAIGGIICAVVAGVVYSLILKNSVRLTLLYAAMCLVGSAIAQIGDFAASCIKRDCNVKDYGFILPGHGGFMDRFDSVVFAAPFVCLAVTYLAGIR